MRAATASSSSSQSASASSSPATSHRRYLKELSTHLSRLRLSFTRPTATATSRSVAVRPVDRLAVYRALQSRHCYFVEFACIELPDAIAEVGERRVGVRLRVSGEDGEVREERAEVVVEVKRLVQGDGRRKRSEEALRENRRRELERTGGVDEDEAEDAAAARAKKKGQERAGVSKAR